VNHSEAGRLGYEKTRSALAERSRLNRAAALDRWGQKNCGLCCKPIPYARRRNTFCSHACAASFNNGHRTPKSRKAISCLMCGGLLRKQRVYCSVKCQKDYEFKMKMEHVVACRKLPARSNSSGARRIMLAIQGSKCACCDLSEWNGTSIPLTLDHINGNSDDWSLANLRMICPNCDAQSPTFTGRNRGKGRAWRRERYARKKK
jgi:5-methylcytosine-specific restriction endonuclease McrA